MADVVQLLGNLLRSMTLAAVSFGVNIATWKESKEGRPSSIQQVYADDARYRQGRPGKLYR